MATAQVVPTTAQDIQTLETALAAEANISATTINPDDAVNGATNLTHVFVTGVATTDIEAAVAAVGDCEIVGDTLTA